MGMYIGAAWQIRLIFVLLYIILDIRSVTIMCKGAVEAAGHVTNNRCIQFVFTDRVDES